MGESTTTMRFAPALLGAGAAALILAATAACGSTAKRYAGADGARRLYEARCGLCHVAYAPTDFSPQEWPDIVESMSARAGLTRSQRVRVLAYLVAPAGDGDTEASAEPANDG